MKKTKSQQPRPMRRNSIKTDAEVARAMHNAIVRGILR